MEVIDNDGDFIKTINPNKGLCSCAEFGYEDGIEFYIKEGANDLNTALYIASRHGHKNIVELLISHGANAWNDGMCVATSRGHKNIVELLINHGANKFQQGFCIADRIGNKELKDFFHQKILANLNFLNYKCKLCNEKENEDIIITKCNHVFHRKCINLWIYSNPGNVSCPTCGKSLR